MMGLAKGRCKKSHHKSALHSRPRGGNSRPRGGNSRPRGGNRPKIDVILYFYHYAKLKLE